MIKHFGVSLRDREGGFKLTEGNFIPNSNNSGLYPGTVLTDEECQRLRRDAKINLEYNLSYFTNLDREEFNQSINDFCRITGFVKITDLSKYSLKSGFYLMVMDEYCQFYLGCSKDLKKRIMRHWSQVMPLDRLVLFSAEMSKLSIDSFCALDTTRIYILLANEDSLNDEDRYINMLPDKFLANRNKGGRLEPKEIMRDIKTRDFNI